MKTYRIFVISVIVTAVIVAVKYLLHTLGWERIEITSLHSSLISGVIFVLGFLMSATIKDYKEAERIPADVASAIENMHEDAESIHTNYPKFDLKDYHKKLQNVAKAFASDVRSSKSHQGRKALADLTMANAQMEAAGVPANFVVKIKQQQALIVRHLYRVNYIQRITFIPSATILAWSIVLLAIMILLFSQADPFYAGLVLAGAITFILVYVLQLLHVIRTPFHEAGKTMDDVSLFLLDDQKPKRG